MVANQHFPHSGIDVQAEATRIVRRFGFRTEQYMIDWIATFQPNDPMAAVVRAVQAEALRQVALT